MADSNDIGFILLAECMGHLGDVYQRLDDADPQKVIIGRTLIKAVNYCQLKMPTHNQPQGVQ